MHFTYAKYNAETDLEQGDLIQPTPALKQILGEVHPHFCDDKYLGFIIVTQSCDLVRRGTPPKPNTRYISIAVIRSLRDVLPRVLESVIDPVVPGSGLFSTQSKGEARRFLARLVDQNEQTLGLFYLHPDADVGLGESAVAFLRVKVVLKSSHYQLLMESRTGRLDAEYRGKLGWMLGYLYSRAASRDWADFSGGKVEVEELISHYLKENTSNAGPVWVDDVLINSGKQAGINFANRPRDELLCELENHRPLPPHERLAEEVSKQSQNVLIPNAIRTAQLKAKVIEALAPDLKQLIEDYVAKKDPKTLTEFQNLQSLIEKVVALALDYGVKEFCPNANNLASLANRIKNNGIIKKLLKQE